jgi:hypothetical protein
MSSKFGALSIIFCASYVFSESDFKGTYVQFVLWKSTDSQHNVRVVGKLS